MILFCLHVLLLQGDPGALVEKLASDSVVERVEAERKLRELGKDSVPHLERAAKSPDLEVALRARRLLRAIAIRAQVTPALLKAIPGVEERLLAGGDPAWADVLIEAVSWQDGRRRHPLLCRDDLLPLADRAVRFARSPVERQEACVLARLWVLPGAAPALVDLLADDVGGIRFSAGEALVAIGASGQSPRILPLLRHGRADVRNSAATVLAGLGGPESARAIAALLEDPEEYVRLNALWALLPLGDASVAPSVRPFLEHRTHMLRRAALEVLAAAGDRESLPSMRRMLARDPTVEVEAMEALAVLGERDAVSEISSRLEARLHSTRMGALRSLDRLDAIDLETLRRCFRDPDESVRMEAAVGLAHRGDASGGSHLVRSPLRMDSLNGARRPEDWSRLRATRVTGALEGSAGELYARLAKLAGLRLELPEEGEPSHLWPHVRLANPGDRLSLADALRRVSGWHHVVLEPGAIRLLHADDAAAFWNRWLQKP